GKDQAIAEAVEVPTPGAAHHETDGDGIVERERLHAQVVGEDVAPPRRVTEAEALDRLGADAALSEVGPAACARRTAQGAAEEGRRRLTDCDQGLAARAAARRSLRHPGR